VDLEQLLGLLDRLVDSGKSVIVRAGHDGGRVVFEGTPADLVRSEATLSGRHLAEFVGSRGMVPELADGLRGCVRLCASARTPRLERSMRPMLAVANAATLIARRGRLESPPSSPVTASLGDSVPRDVRRMC
jgi:hypothetical protein